MRTSMKIFLLSCLLIYIIGIGSTEAKHQEERPKIGLVLGGGGAKGAATVGALKYIEKSGIPIDYIAGTSIGSIIGGLYACGYRSEELDSMFRSQEWMNLLTDRNMEICEKPIVKRDGVTYLFGFPIARKGSKQVDKSVGMIRGDKIFSLLDSMITTKLTMTNKQSFQYGDSIHHQDSISFDSLPIPFRCVATDYINRQKVILKNGNLARSMRASMAIPGAFKAIDINGIELLDGGLVDNLPVDVVLDMGADIVIAIDLTVKKHEDSKAWKRERKAKKYENAEKFMGQLLHWITQRPDISQYQENLRHINVYINPDLKGFSAASFSDKKVIKMIEKGEEAGKKAIKDLLKINKKIQKQHK